MDLTYNQSTSVSIPHSDSIKPSLTESFRSLFYLILPSESMFKDVAHVPDYTTAASPAFFILIALEFIIASLKGKQTLRANDGITSVSAGVNSRLISQMHEQLSQLNPITMPSVRPRLLTKKSLELTMFIYIHEKWRLVDLPWDSSLTWFLSFLGMDFSYYWFHRAAHEINILWIAHQTHHSSEDYNLTTALRQSAFQAYGSMFFFLPCALVIPPSVHLVHLQVNILFQFWIHTELIDSLGPLEYVLNTPSHHRVHHGRNPYCIDKNYAGALIIWDRIFGTFAAERKDEKVVYGLVSPLNSFNPFYVQLAYIKAIIERAWNIQGFSNKLSVFVKGPGWSPGKPRLGELADIPQVEQPVVRYGSEPPKWLAAYSILHCLALVPVFDKLMLLRLKLASDLIILDVLFILWGLTCLGFLFDRKAVAFLIELHSLIDQRKLMKKNASYLLLVHRENPKLMTKVTNPKNTSTYAYHFECIRCLVSALICQVGHSDLSAVHELPPSVFRATQIVYILSAFIWIVVLSSKSRKKAD